MIIADPHPGLGLLVTFWLTVEEAMALGKKPNRGSQKKSFETVLVPSGWFAELEGSWSLSSLFRY
jgi:hypothetical protein